MLWIFLIGIFVVAIGLFVLVAYIAILVALSVAGAVYFLCFLVCLQLFPADLLPAALLVSAVVGTLVNYGLYRAFVPEDNHQKQSH